MIREEGLPIPIKSACWYCPSSTKIEIAWLRDNHPDLFERALAMERNALESSKHELRNIKGLGRHFAWADLARLPQVEIDKLPNAPVESCTFCADDVED